MPPKSQPNIPQTWILDVVEDPSDPSGILLDIGPEICDILGWVPGDEIKWVDNNNGSYTLQKKR
jgi:hypothetical protein